MSATYKDLACSFFPAFLGSFCGVQRTLPPLGAASGALSIFQRSLHMPVYTQRSSVIVSHNPNLMTPLHIFDIVLNHIFLNMLSCMSNPHDYKVILFFKRCFM